MKKENMSISIPVGMRDQLKLGAVREGLSISDFLIFKALGVRPVVRPVSKKYKKIIKGKEYIDNRYVRKVTYE